MGKMGYLAMKTDEVSNELIESDLKELGIAARRLANHAFNLGSGLGFGTTFLKFLASFAAIYLLILDRTNWRTNMLTSLLIPYIFLSLPSVLFNFLRNTISAVLTQLQLHFFGGRFVFLYYSLPLLIQAIPGSMFRNGKNRFCTP